MFAVVPRSARFAVQAIVLLILLCPTTRVFGADVVTFKFAPPDGTKCIVREKAVETVHISPGEKHTEVANLTERFTFIKTLDGYRVADQLLKLDLSEDGRPVEPPGGSLLDEMLELGLTQSADLDANGRIIKSHDEEVLGKIRAVTKAWISPALLNLIIDALKSSPAEDAGVSVCEIDVVGKTANIGELVEVVHVADTPGGYMRFPAKARLVERVKVGGENCLKVRSYCNPDAELVRSKIESSINGDTSEILPPDVEQAKVKSASYVCEITMVVDPDTMLTHSSTSSETIEFTAYTPSEGELKVKLTATSDKKYEYLK